MCRLLKPDHRQRWIGGEISSLLDVEDTHRVVRTTGQGSFNRLRLTVMWSNSLKVEVPWPEVVVMWSRCRCTEPLCHSQLPSCPTATTWPSRFFMYTGPFTPYLEKSTGVVRSDQILSDLCTGAIRSHARFHFNH